MAKRRTEIQKKYDSANCRFFYLKFNRKTDADVIRKLEYEPNKTNYIRELIRRDLNGNEGK